MKSLARRSGAVLKSSKQDHDTRIKGLTESGSGKKAKSAEAGDRRDLRRKRS